MSRIVTFGEIMARLATPGYKRFQQAMPGMMEVTFAGAEASIAASLAYLGRSSSFVTALPKHAIADSCIADLRSLGVATDHIVRTDSGRLGLYFFERGINQRSANVIYDRDGSAIALAAENDFDWEAIFEGAEWFVISGITPAISRSASVLCTRALNEAVKRGVKVACDMNYRSKLWQWEPSLTPRELATRTMRALMPKVTLFVGGREDAEEMLGIQGIGSQPQDLAELARLIVQQFASIKLVAMTRRESVTASDNKFGGMLYVAENDRVSFSPLENGQPSLYSISDIVDRLGAGDAFTAGLLYALTSSDLKASDDVISFAVAAGCLAHSIDGDFNYVSRSEIESLVAGNSSGRVRR